MEPGGSMPHSQSAEFKREILKAKRECFNFISNINYQQDSARTYKFLGKLLNKYSIPKKNPILHRGNQFNSDTAITNAFAITYSHAQKKSDYTRRLSKTTRRDYQSTVSSKGKDKNSTHIIPNFEEPFELIEVPPILQSEVRIAVEELKNGKTPGEITYTTNISKWDWSNYKNR